MKVFHAVLLCCIPAILACAGGHKFVDKSQVVLGRVDGRPITAAEMDSIAGAKNIIISDTTDVQLLKQNLLDSLIDLKLIDIRVDSIKALLEQDRSFIERRNSEIANNVFRLMFDGEITFKIQMDSSEIDSFYSQHPEQFMTPEQVRVAHILISTPKPETAGVKSAKAKEKIIAANEKESLKRAKAILAKAKSGENWDSLCAKYSEDKNTNQKGGDIGLISRGRMGDEFDSLAFAAEIGSVVGPAKTIRGFHIIKVSEHIMPALKPLDSQLRGTIRASLFRNHEKEKADKFVDSLKSAAHYEFNEPILDLPDSLVQADQWVMIVNEKDTVFADRLLQNLPKFMRLKKYTEATPAVKRELLQDMSVNNLLRAAGKTLGYYDNPKVISAGIEFTDREARFKLDQIMRDSIYQPTEEEVKEYYDSHFEERYREKKPLKVQHIIFQDSALALVIRDSLLQGADFKEMALRYYPGEIEIREIAFDLGYISEQEMGQTFFEAVKQLEVGQISLPIKTVWGYHIAKLVDKRQDKSLDQVRPGIRDALKKSADNAVKKQMLEQWRESASIIIEKRTFEKYEFPEVVKPINLNQGS